MLASVFPDQRGLRDKNGNTIAHYIAKYGDLDHVGLLSIVQEDVFLPNAENDTALDLCVKSLQIQKSIDMIGVFGSYCGDVDVGLKVEAMEAKFVEGKQRAAFLVGF